MRYEFGHCRIDTSSREVNLDGVAMELSPKAFELVRLLIDARPRVVTKTELMHALWPDTFVQEANLPVLIHEARVAIGDAEAAQVIKTHHRVGYAFTAEVRESHSPSGRPPASQGAFVLVLPDRRVVLAEGQYTVGRHADCDVHVNDGSVSRLHARVVIESGTARVEDLHSMNGTRVQGLPATEPTVLAVGDVVSFGAVDARFLAEEPSETATHAMPPLAAPRSW